VSISFLLACPSTEDHLEVCPAFLQQFLESIHKFAFLRTDGAGTSPPTFSKLLAKRFCRQAVADALLPCFTEKCNVEKSSVTVPVSDVFDK